MIGARMLQPPFRRYELYARLPPQTGIMSGIDLLNLDEYETAARATLPREVYDYFAGGAEDERTIRSNREAFARYALRTFLWYFFVL